MRTTASKFRRLVLAGGVVFALGAAALAPVSAEQGNPDDATPPPLGPAGANPTIVQAPVPTPTTPADLPQPDPTPIPGPNGNALPPGQVYPISNPRTTEVPLSSERRVDLVTKQAKVEGTRTLTPQEQAGVNMTDQWAAKSADFQTQSNVNGSVVLAFNSSLPTITAAILELTDVELQPGEAVTSVNVGDTTRWVIAVTNSQEGELQRAHLIIKPLDEGLKTSLVVTTSKRTYHLLLQLSFDRFMHYVTFTYSEDPEVAAMQQKRDAEIAALQKAAARSRVEAQGKLPRPVNPGPAMPSIAYRIDGRAPWQPLYAYTDGVKTYIQMPPSMSQTEAPSLLALRRGKGLWGDDKVIVNYRVQHNRYIVDSVLDRALMVIGKEEVKLTKKIVPPPAAKTTRTTSTTTAVSSKAKTSHGK